MTAFSAVLWSCSIFFALFLSGENVTSPKFPWALCFIPNEELRAKFVGRPASNCVYDLLKDVEAGQRLYDVWAISEPYPLADPQLLKK